MKQVTLYEYFMLVFQTAAQKQCRSLWAGNDFEHCELVYTSEDNRNLCEKLNAYEHGFVLYPTYIRINVLYNDSDRKRTISVFNTTDRVVTDITVSTGELLRVFEKYVYEAPIIDSTFNNSKFKFLEKNFEEAAKELTQSVSAYAFNLSQLESVVEKKPEFQVENTKMAQPDTNPASVVAAEGVEL